MVVVVLVEETMMAARAIAPAAAAGSRFEANGWAADMTRHCSGSTLPSLAPLLARVRACTLCAEHLPLGPRPVLQLDPAARILVAAQAPGLKVHETGIPFNDASGDRLRAWLGVSREQFYDPALFAIVPMGLCYPGRGASGDRPPRPECAPRWRAPLLQCLHRLQLTLVIGQYAVAYHLPQEREGLTAAVQNWRQHWPAVLPLPHPSPTNNRWLARNRWFEQEVVPLLRTRVADIVSS
jgi:uracil-DNA glycosylase